MAPTVSSTVRNKKSLNLREKIFELHDAVKELQSKPLSQTYLDQDPHSSNKLESNKLDSIEKELTKLKKAIGTLADAVSEEFEDLNQKLT
jgi:hypothetical protein